MKKIYIPLFALISLAVIIFIITRFDVSNIYVEKGYIVSDNDIKNMLYNENYSEIRKKVNLVNIDEDDVFYTSLGQVFVDKNYDKQVDVTYPMFTQDGASVIDINSKSKLINSNFEFFDSYENAILVDGALYNRNDSTKADNENYLFIKLKNNLYVNLFDAVIRTNTLEKTIPLNSIMNIQNNSISYYYFKDGNLYYDRLNGIDNSNYVKMSTNSFSYEKLLFSLGSLEKLTSEKEISSTIEVSESNKEKEKPLVELNKYTKPIIKVNNLSSNVYSVNASLSIKDPNNTLIGGVNFYIYEKDKLFLRKAFSNEGNITIEGLKPNTKYTIVGSYRFYDKDGNKAENTFYNNSFTTKKLDTLKSVDISFENGEIYSDCIEIKKIKLITSINSEIVKNINNVYIIVDEVRFKMFNNEVAELKSGAEITYKTSNVLKSNSIINYVISITDTFGNEYKVVNNTGKTRTAKLVPTASVVVNQKEINDIDIYFNTSNPDSVNIVDYKYIIRNEEEIIHSSGNLSNQESSQVVNFSDLRSGEKYTISVVGSYDILDGKGLMKDVVICETSFATTSISSLGYLRVLLKASEKTSNSFKIEGSLDENNEPLLLQLISSVNFQFVDENGEIAFEKIFIGDELDLIRNCETFEFNVTGLVSNTLYYVNVEASVKQGSEEVSVKTYNNTLSSVKTYKQDARISIVNKFISNNLIDFDYKLEDPDGAVISERVILEIKDNNDDIILVKYLSNSNDFDRITLNKLTVGVEYKVNFIVEEYNIGFDNFTIESSKSIYNDIMKTEESIFGKVELYNSLNTITSKNLFNIKNSSNIRIEGVVAVTKEVSYDYENNIVKYSAKNGIANFGYYLYDYVGEIITVSFKAKYSANGTGNVYLANGISTSAKTKLILNKTNNENKEWVEVSYSMTLNSKGYVGFLIEESDNMNNTTEVSIKDLQIELGDKTEYVQYSEEEQLNSKIMLTLTDKLNSIENKKYYVRVFENNKPYTPSGCHFNEETNNSECEYEIKNGEINYVNYKLNRNKTYTFYLSIKVREANSDKTRYYDISNLSFTTESEIRAISTIDDLYSVHTNGRYIVLNDLNLIGDKSGYTSTFLGSIDFQGHSITTGLNGKSYSYIIYRLGSSGVIKNLVLNLINDNTSGLNGRGGFIYENFGIIDNIMINVLPDPNVEESNKGGNYGFGAFARANYGTISNFVINSEISTYYLGYSGLLTYYNQGNIKNGYAYGKNIYVTGDNKNAEFRAVGIITGYATTNSIIENVYSLIGVVIPETFTLDGVSKENLGTGSIVGHSQAGTIKNVYSVLDFTNIRNGYNSFDPNVGNYKNGSVINSYYVSDNMYNTTFDQKISKQALHDISYQNQVLNSNDAFEVNEYVSLGYFPKLKLNDCMPSQKWIPLPLVEESSKIDIISLEVTNSSGSEADVMFKVNNPSHETITSIVIQKISNVDIIEQNHVNGITKVKAHISNPEEYLSKYYVKSITSTNAAGIEGTPRLYADNERVLIFDLYRPISTFDDWKNLINEKNDENFILMNDFDFDDKSMSEYLITTFTGKLNGNNKVIKNINITNANGLINSLDGGTIENLYIENFVIDNYPTEAGFVSKSKINPLSKETASIKNVHMYSTKDKGLIMNSSSVLGGLIGFASDTNIIDSSVNSINLSTKNDSFDISVGGIVGKTLNCSIANSYAGNLNIDINDSQSAIGIGGIVGYMQNGSINNTYSSGKIKANTSPMGGIIGKSTGSVKNAYSFTSLNSKSDFLGGIVGDSSNTYISNTLSVGDIFSSYDTVWSYRTVGNQILNQKNFAWIGQNINGLSSEQNVHGEVLLTTKQLQDINTYKEVIQFDENFIYDNVFSKALPLLKYSDGSKELPNQTYNYKLVDRVFSLREINIKTTGIGYYVTSADIAIQIDNPNDLNITGIEFDYLNINSIPEITIDFDTKITTIRIENLTPKKFIDGYTITKIKYEENGVEKEFDCSYKMIDINEEESSSLRFYKKLEGCVDWVQTDRDIAENYYIENDINFNDCNNINNTIFNRLEGVINKEGKKPYLKNITISSDNGDVYLIKRLMTSMKNIGFSNVSIKSGTKSFSNYANIIKMNYGNLENIDFIDVNIYAPKSYYVAPIGINRSNSIKEITIKNNDLTKTITGYRYVSGFIGYSNQTDVTGISAVKLNVTGKNSFVAGLFGYKECIVSSKIYDFDISVIDSNISGINYVGAVYGYGAGSDIQVKNVTIKGNSYIGGAVGQLSTLDSTNVIGKNLTVVGSGEYIGGLIGYTSRRFKNYYLLNSSVSSSNDTASYIGGITGYAAGYSSLEAGIVNTSIKGNKHVGGIAGYLGNVNLSRTFVNNTESKKTIEGNYNVGGTVGYAATGSYIYNSFVSSTIKSSNDYSGGIVGYTPKNDSNSEASTSHIFNNIVANSNIYAKNNAGGLLGYTDRQLDPKNFYGNLIVANISINPPINGDKYIGFITSRDEKFRKDMNSIYVYNYSTKTINDETIALYEMDDSIINDARKISSDQLKKKSTYVNGLNNLGLLLSQSIWELSNKEYDNFPKQKQGLEYQLDIPLPTSELVRPILASTSSINKMDVPGVIAYSSGINTINIEFDYINNNANYNIYFDDKLVDSDYINELTMSYEYNYKSKIVIELNMNSINKKYEYDSNDLRKSLVTNKDKYVYIKDNKINGNIKLIDDGIIHVYGNSVLTNDDRIYDFMLEKYLKEGIDNGKKLSKVIPLYSFVYDDKKINTYYNYSSIIENDVEKTVDYQIIINNGTFEIFDKNLDNNKSSYIVDKYNNKTISSVLGNDGVLYNLKDDIKYPTGMMLSDIIEISNNISNSSKLLLIKYSSGKVVVLDYVNGKIVSQCKANETTDIIQYFKKNFKLASDKAIMTSESDYIAATQLEKDLQKNVITNATPNSSKYETKSTARIHSLYYDIAKKQYDIMDVQDLLDTDKNDKVSELDKIYSAYDKYNYFMKKSNISKVKNNIDFTTIIMIIVIGILIFLGLYYKNTVLLLKKEDK